MTNDRDRRRDALAEEHEAAVDPDVYVSRVQAFKAGWDASERDMLERAGEEFDVAPIEREFHMHNWSPIMERKDFAAWGARWQHARDFARILAAEDKLAQATSLTRQAQDLCVKQQARIQELEAELKEEARVNGAGASREAKLRAELEAERARGERYREALQLMLDHVCDGGGDRPCSQMWFQDVAEAALSDEGGGEG